MGLFEKTADIDESIVQNLLQKHYDKSIRIIKKIKGSQNHTYEAQIGEEGKSIAVRVTPDPTGKHIQRIEQEVEFVNFLAASNEVNYICAPLALTDGRFVVNEENLVIVVFEWAKGEPINFIAYEWLNNEELVTDWGRWFASYHRISRRFAEVFPEKVRKFQSWDDIHEGILRGSTIIEEDQGVVLDPLHYGVIHGDLNLSNFFYLREERTLSVFDWDQTQQGWYLWDVAQALVAVVMLSEAGSIIDNSPVSNIDVEQFEGWLVHGYESVAGANSIDRPRLKRMLELRLSFYEKFCRQALAEGDIPKDMEHFINYIVNWFDNRRSR